MFQSKHVLTTLIALFLTAHTALAFETTARAAYMIDFKTGTVLMEKDAESPLPPASMSKLMTLYMAFEALRDGRLRIDEELPVSEHAMSFGGSTMFLDTTDRVSVEDLLRGIIVLSGNDACVVIAEALSPDGTEAGFARMMTERAKKMGMMQSTFTNSSGWPQAGHRMSMKDLGILAQALIRDFPTYYPLFAETEFAFDGRAPQNTRNRNPLLSLGIGADGLKTGHTQEAGYGLVGSAKQGDRRVIFVITGLDTVQDRAREAQRLVTWSFRQFTEQTVLRSGHVVAEADVWMGAVQTVPMTVAEDLNVLVPANETGAFNANIKYRGPLEAPISKGDVIGELVITFDDIPETRVDLVAAEDVARGGIIPRLRTAALHLSRRIGAQDF
jgi:D-alanyl-D-alanine carboxypeptidase (penicillin-binding protein 5/6)